MGKSMAEFVEKYSAVKYLVKNLEANMNVFCDGWTKE